MIDAEALLGAARRPIVIGIGGGGDVVGALATAEAARIYAGADPIVGGISWERAPIDPEPGPRTVAEIDGAEEVAPGVLLARPETCVRASGVRFAESRMAEFLGAPTLLVDPGAGPSSLAGALADARRRLGGDLLVFLDVGGDVVAEGSEPGLGSPLCDALLLAAAAELQRAREPVLAAIFGVGCDGELTLSEVSARLALVARAGGLAGARGLTAPVAGRVEAAIEHVVTEASAQAVRAFRGIAGRVEIRGGRRSLELTPAAAATIFLDPVVAYEAAAPLARAVAAASDLEEANAALGALGVTTELDAERTAARHGAAPAKVGRHAEGSS